MKLYIKNMVCDRCKIMVEQTLKKYNLQVLYVNLGEIELAENEINSSVYSRLKNDFNLLGFELLEDKKKVLVNEIKTLIISLVHYNDTILQVNLSDYLSDKLDTDYHYLSSIFSNEEQQTIEKYFILQKIERVKELLSYGELTLSEIAYQLNYSSVAHLSAQFKKETELTPSQYKQQIKRKTLDKI